jgi:hypothetical protein
LNAFNVLPSHHEPTWIHSKLSDDVSQLFQVKTFEPYGQSIFATFCESLQRIQFGWCSASGALESRWHVDQIRKLWVGMKSPKCSFRQDGIMGRGCKEVLACDG